ncbi:hypothetical protein U9M48_016310 [Paspalum notatum var. saurae]|uniref:Uncharacterized protein n=1 Tax=Paspalum notatum var. saurae TaxID=547442 RepID=A0AAQ3WMY5_PASNO
MAAPEKKAGCSYLQMVKASIHDAHKNTVFKKIKSIRAVDIDTTLKYRNKHVAGHLVMVKVVLLSIPVYLMLAMDLPKWLLKAIDKRRCFLLKGQENASRGNFLVSWECVQQPMQFVGLGILNLELFGWALSIRWLRLQKTDPSRPWVGLPIQVPCNAEALFDIAVVAMVSNVESIKFWTDRWLQGVSALQELLLRQLTMGKCGVWITKKSIKKTSTSQKGGQ